MTLGKRIMQQRKRIGLTQEQLAEKLGVTAQAVSKWENDQSCPDISILPKLADIFGITTDALLGREPEEPVHNAEVVEDDSILHVQKNDWDLKVNYSRKGALALSFLVLAVGIQLLIAKVTDYDISFWSALWPTALIVYGLLDILSNFSFLKVVCVLLGGYFLLEKWGILPFEMSGELVFPAILVIFGLILLVDALKKKPNIRITRGGQAPRNLTMGDDSFEYNAAFAENDEYICCEKLREGEINVSFGEYTVDLSGVQSITAGSRINANCAFGELTLLVPSRFRVEMQRSTFLASVELEGQHDAMTTGTVLIEANASFGEISVEYI